MEILQGIFQFDLSFLNSYVMPLGGKITPQNTPYFLTGGLMVIMVALSLTPMADSLLRFAYGFRLPIKEEREQLQTLFTAVCQAANKNPNDYHLYIVDEVFPNAYALGHNHVAITRKLLKEYNANEIKGVLAHELGHLHYGDTVKTRVFITVCLIGQTALIAYHCIASLLAGLSKVPIPIINLVCLFASWMFSIQAWLIQILLILPLSIGAMFGSRQDEYRADKYAITVGQGEGLYAFLYRLLDSDNGSSNSFLAILQRSHPKTGNRIRRIEECGVALHENLNAISTKMS